MSDEAQCERLLIIGLRDQVRDPKTTATDRRQARDMLRSLQAEQNGKAGPGSFTSGCGTFTIPVTRTAP